MPRPNNVGVGVACALINGSRMMFIERIGKHAAHNWSFVGGWVDHEDVSLEDSISREIEEELGIRVRPNQFSLLSATSALHHDIEEDPVRTVTVCFIVELNDDEVAEIKNMEPEKCAQIKWFDLVNGDEPPLPMFPGLAKSVTLAFERCYRNSIK